jgi:hypothetical protein
MKYYILLTVLVIGVFFGLVEGAFAQPPQVCPHGAVKYDVGAGYEYGAEYAQIIVTEPTVTWLALGDFVISKVCIKVGGPGGGEVISFPVDGDGSWTNYTGYDVSHVVLYGSPTSVFVTGFWVSGDWGEKSGWALVFLFILLAITFAAAASRGTRVR